MSTYGYPAATNYQSSQSSFQPLSPAMSHTYPYLPHNPNPSEIESYNRRQAQSQTARLARPANSKHDHRNQFLNVETIPTYHRRRMGGHTRTGSHSSNAPSLTRSYSSGEEEDELPRTSPNTPYSAKVALWQDGVQAASPYDEFGYLGKRHYEPARAHVSEAHIDNTCLAIEQMVYELNERVLAFTFPKHLDVEETANGQRLAYTTRNKPVLEHREYLERLLTKLDETPSHGSQRIVETRREAARIANQQLDQLERMEKMMRHNLHYEQWKKTPRIHVTEPELAPL
ncbi:hypothetical protein RhiJN_15286 [Ceratobasidium sp. AG-Ba]|nr:hypothetical protein RhiJN_15286 [Ceratobasidium sp. AG-Ba]